jgi:hypothetical protein
MDEVIDKLFNGETTTDDLIEDGYSLGEIEMIIENMQD